MNSYLSNSLDTVQLTPPKKVLFIFIFASLPLLSFAQEPTKQYYIYNFLTLSETITGFRVDIDNGEKVERLKDEKGKVIKFKTPAAVLMYMISKGWELCINGDAQEISGSNGSSRTKTVTYWLIKKPCSKEEFDNAVIGGIKD
ncbi:MAG: hypothetical protein IKK07_04320 [Bacteroides sp.]|nr:hypothetical protein [Bacteroides sp.]